jgi:hypothetical protein
VHDIAIKYSIVWRDLDCSPAQGNSPSTAFFQWLGVLLAEPESEKHSGPVSVSIKISGAMNTRELPTTWHPYFQFADQSGSLNSLLDWHFDAEKIDIFRQSR